MTHTSQSLKTLDNRYRANMINCISGFKAAALIGTVSENGNENLAIFNSIVHIGANPPLLGFILRPTTVRRDTYENIKATGSYTINHITPQIIKQAHQTAASYDKDKSEFTATGLSPEHIEGINAPFVKESYIKIGMEYVNEYPIEENGTILIIGKIISLRFPDNIQTEDGWLDLQQADTIATGGLDSYYSVSKLSRLSYAVPDKMPEEI